MDGHNTWQSFDIFQAQHDWQIYIYFLSIIQKKEMYKATKQKPLQRCMPDYVKPFTKKALHMYTFKVLSLRKLEKIKNNRKTIMKT